MNNQYGYYNMPPTSGYYPPQNNMVYNPVPPVAPKKRKLLPILLISVVVLLVVGFVIWKLFVPKNKKYTYATLKDTNAFFLPNDENYYALFNEDGKQLTEFQFDKVGEFYGGVTKVTNEEGKFAIIKENGSYLVKFTDDEILSYQSLFLIKPKEGKSRLINYEGKKLLEEESIAVSSFDDASLFLVSTDKEKVTVMNYNGTKIEDLKKKKYSKSIATVDGLVTLIGNQKTYLYKLDTGTKIYETDGSYCITKADGSAIVLSSCANPDNVKNYKLIKDGKELYTMGKNLCDSIEIMEDGNFACKSAGSSVYRFINPDGTTRDAIIASYHTQNDYVEKNGINLVFYVDNKERYRVSCANLEKSVKSGYLIKYYAYGECLGKEEGLAYYNVSGEKVSPTYHQTSEWDDLGRAIVSSKMGSVYLVNQKFEQVSSEYRMIQPVNHLYIAMNANGNYTLLNEDLKEIENGFKSYKMTTREDKPNYLALVYPNKIVLYDSMIGEKIGENNGTKVTLTDHYYKIDAGYYSYRTGKHFYTKE